MITISMPLYVIHGFVCKKRKRVLDKHGKPKPRKYHFNLNNYRNWNPHLSNELKKMYKDITERKLNDAKFLAPLNPVELTFVMYRGDKRKVDRANVLSIHEKFFCDALVELGYMGDDNDKFITSSHYYSGGLDRENPRVDIIIKEC
ncbi:hypothetical protein LCGC14_1855120 [marine sediment metagenome]|uniref:Uncharacterized protein n=1 Tax=marine sediment metagenome TaxID=412755 RepID=A0A0F9G9M8_9ZZZZ